MKYKPEVIIGIGIAVMVVLLLPPIFVVSYYWCEIISEFKPYNFLSEYLKFLGGLLSLVLGFLLVNLYWERKLEFTRSSSLRRILLSQLVHIGKLAWETGSILDKHVTTREESLLKDQKVFSNVKRLGDTKDSIILLANEIVSTKDEQLIAEIALFIRDIDPKLESLSNLVNENSTNDGLRESIALIGKAVQDMIQRLRGGRT